MRTRIKNFWTEYADAFRHSMIKPGFKVGRRIAFTGLVLLALASWTGGIIFLSMGYWNGLIVVICGFTFAFTSMTVVFMAATDEHHKETERNIARMSISMWY